MSSERVRHSSPYIIQYRYIEMLYKARQQQSKNLVFVSAVREFFAYEI